MKEERKNEAVEIIDFIFETGKFNSGGYSFLLTLSFSETASDCYLSVWDKEDRCLDCKSLYYTFGGSIGLEKLKEAVQSVKDGKFSLVEEDGFLAIKIQGVE